MRLPFARIMGREAARRSILPQTMTNAARKLTAGYIEEPHCPHQAVTMRRPVPGPGSGHGYASATPGTTDGRLDQGKLIHRSVYFHT
jgi:hypothetical protein